MAAVIVALAVAMVAERMVAGCFQKSVSAYYYTPVRAVFVGALVALCLGMVAILGRNTFEDAFLNLAGLFAPVVAFVPTKQTNRCNVVGVELDGSKAPQPEQAELAIANNMWTFFIVIAIGLLAAGFLPGGPLRSGKASYIWSFWAAVIVCVGGFAAFRLYDNFNNVAHLFSAISLFTCVIVVVFAGAYLRTGRKIRRILTDRYGLVGGGMVLSVLVVVGLHLLIPSWQYWILVIEALLIGFFGVFWFVQTVEHWVPLDKPAKAD